MKKALSIIKKLLITSFLIILFLVCCNSIVVHMDGWANPVNSNDDKIDVRLYEYDGHTYLIFGGTKFTNGVVHDPNCSCLEKED